MYISVVIPTYNRADTLQYVLSSLAAQNFPKEKYEILLCDSSSTDGTKDLLEKLRIPNLRHIIVENKGRAHARNAGIKNARDGIILFTDADIIADKNLIAEHARMHEKHPDLAVVGCEIQANSIEDVADIIKGVKSPNALHPVGRRHLPWYFFLTGNASALKESLLQVGCFDEDFKGYGHEDLELGYRLVRTKHHIVYNPKAVNYHLHPVGFEEKCDKMFQSGIATVKFYDKHRDLDVKLRLGYTPLSLFLHSAISPDSWFFKYCRNHAGKSSLCREIILQHYYINGIKSAVDKKRRKKSGGYIAAKGDIDKEEVKRILVIRIDHLGDVICSLPFIKALRENFPNAETDVVMSSYTQQALHKSSLIHEVFVFNPGYSRIETGRLVNLLKSRKYDIAVALSPTSWSYYLAGKSRAKRRFGWVYVNRLFVAASTKFSLTDALYLNYEKALKKGEKIPHEVEQAFSLAQKMGMQITDKKLFINITDEEKLENEKNLKLASYGKCVGVHISPKWFGTDFLDTDFTGFIDKVLENFAGYNVIITAGPGESDYADIFESKLKNDRVMFFKDLNFKEWATVLGHCKIVITMDTGATHVSAAAGTPTVCVFEDENYKKCSMQWYPWGVPHILYKKSDIKGLMPQDFEKMKNLITETQRHRE